MTGPIANLEARTQPAHDKSSFSILSALPSELLNRILGFALLSNEVGKLSTLSRTIHDHVNDVLYTIVVLRTQEDIRLFNRTALLNPPILSRVKKLTITWQAERSCLNMENEIRNIISACTQIHALEIPVVDALTVPDMSHHLNLVDFTTQYVQRREYGSLGGKLKGLTRQLTHLRMAEPLEYGWIRPVNVLKEFGNPAQLTHFQLARRTNANEENDAIFAEDVKAILQNPEFPNLRVLVVTLFNAPFSWEPEPLKETNIWQLLSEVRKGDERLVLTEGRKGEWRDSWKDFKPIDGEGGVGFWPRFVGHSVDL